MGSCCSSMQSRNPYPQNDPSSSSRAIASPASSPTLPRPSTTGSAQRPAPVSRKNKPLKRHVWISTRPEPWTRREIDRERAEFFDTRVTGRPEVWQSIHAALSLLWAGEPEDLINAQGILSAAEITVPTGHLTGQIYDSLGALYTIPEHVVSDPTNIILTDADEEAERGDSEGSNETTESTKRTRREDKGKAVAPPESELLRVRVRLSDGSSDVVLRVGREESVRSIKRRVFDENGLPLDKTIKIIYMGRHLKESSTLISSGWSEGDVVNAFLCGA